MNALLVYIHTHYVYMNIYLYYLHLYMYVMQKKKKKVRKKLNKKRWDLVDHLATCIFFLIEVDFCCLLNAYVEVFIILYSSVLSGRYVLIFILL